MQRFLDVQWNVPSRYRDAGVFVAGDGPQAPLLAIWIGEEDLVLPAVRYLVLASERDRTQRIVPAERAPTLAGSHGRLLDESQLLVDRFAPAEWAGVMDRARDFALERIP